MVELGFESLGCVNGDRSLFGGDDWEEEEEEHKEE